MTRRTPTPTAKWIAARYRDKWNILWMLGGDRPLEPKHRAIVDAMAAGIREADANHLITFHPPGAKDSTDFLADAPYIDFHTAQTGHGIEQCYRSDEVMAKMAAATGKPYLDSEPRYEDHPRASTTASATSGTRRTCARTPTGTSWRAPCPATPTATTASGA